MVRQLTELRRRKHVGGIAAVTIRHEAEARARDTPLSQRSLRLTHPLVRRGYRMRRLAFRLLLHSALAIWATSVWGDADPIVSLNGDPSTFRVTREGIRVDGATGLDSRAGTIVFWVKPEFAPEAEA